MADPVVDEATADEDVPTEVVDAHIGQLIPQALRGAGAETVQFEGGDTLYVVEDDRVVSTVEQAASDDAVATLGTQS